MKIVKQLYQRVNHASDLNARFPQLVMGDGKTHVLFLAGILSPSGYHRMIQPALELNRTNTHSAILANVTKWDYTQRFEDHIFPVDQQLIEWADFLVFPAVFSTLEKLEALREINPRLKLVMDLDECYHGLPPDHALRMKLDEAQLDQLLVNMVAVDRVTAATPRLQSYYSDLLKNAFRYSQAKWASYPNLVSETGFPANFPLMRNTSSTLRIGLFISQNEAPLLGEFSPLLMEILGKVAQPVATVLMGWNHKAKLPEGFVPEIVPPVSILNYYERLNAARLDLALIPTMLGDYDSCKTDIKYRELSALGIPSIASNHPPFTNAIRHGDNGLLADTSEDWDAAINELASKPLLREEIGSYAFRSAWRNLCWNAQKRTMLADIFQ